MRKERVGARMQRCVWVEVRVGGARCHLYIPENDKMCAHASQTERILHFG